QAEDGIRDFHVTGVQTCALPILFKDLMPRSDEVWELKTADLRIFGWLYRPRKFIAVVGGYADDYKGAHNKQNYEDAKRKVLRCRSEERRVGKECRCRWSPYH